MSWQRKFLEKLIRYLDFQSLSNNRNSKLFAFISNEHKLKPHITKLIAHVKDKQKCYSKIWVNKNIYTKGRSYLKRKSLEAKWGWVFLLLGDWLIIEPWKQKPSITVILFAERFKNIIADERIYNLSTTYLLTTLNCCKNKKNR